jgi:hypothetical protein
VPVAFEVQTRSTRRSSCWSCARRARIEPEFAALPKDVRLRVC